MTFRQDKTQGTAGDIKNPISPNNCVVCSVKNLLSQYGCGPRQINHLIHHHLFEEYRARAQRNFENRNNPNYQYEQLTSPEELGQHNLNPTFLTSVLSKGLEMDVDSYHIHENKAAIVNAILRRTPILVFASERDPHTLAGKPLQEGHAYLVWPSQNKDSQEWVIQDSWNDEQPISTKELLKNLDRMHAPSSVYNVINGWPNPEIINGILDAGPIEAGASAQPSTHPQQSATLRQEPAEASTSASKPAQAAPEKPTSKPGSGFQKFRQWLKTRWDGIKQFWQTLTQRIKNWFSGKKSA
jgi:hypothetical protein